MTCPPRCLMSVFLSSAIHTSYPQTCYRWLVIIYEEKKTDQLPFEETSSPTTPEAYRTGRGCSLCKVPSVTKVWIFSNSAVLVFKNQQLSCFFRPQRRKRRRGECETESGRRVLIEGNTDEQKTAEEKLKERLKAKFGGGVHAREEGQPASKRAKISWP